MFALGDISRFEGDNSEKVTSFKILKPVWDVITDYLVIFLAMLSIVFAGMEVTSGRFECLAAVNCPGISSSNTSSFFLSHMKYHNVCKSFYNSQKTNVRIKGTDVMTDLKSSVQYSNFVNSECSKSAIPNFLAYFWFLMFIEAFVLIILDNLWLKLPTTAATIESFVSLVMACYASPCSNLELTKALSKVPNPKVENSASDDSGSDSDQGHELSILDDTATVSAIRTLYEKLETLKEINATSSDKPDKTDKP
ncbi:volume-regulated anion channel subunit LRRC8D-like, partial [Dendronephthya gigantea]|uniref:volume-regulated anion channel subunit LRRC8D-like n=1 Tax=Dendronephthya gigantea TaxID=151771 RepID=UPI00106DA090